MLNGNTLLCKLFCKKKSKELININARIVLCDQNESTQKKMIMTTFKCIYGTPDILSYSTVAVRRKGSTTYRKSIKRVTRQRIMNKILELPVTKAERP